MNLFKILGNRSKKFYLFLLIMGIMSSAWSIGLLMLINNAVAGTSLPFPQEHAWIVFVIILGMAYAVNRIFQTHLIRLTQEIIYKMTLQLVDKLRKASFKKFEEFSQEKVYASMEDITSTSSMPGYIIEGVNNSVIILSCFIYLFCLSPMGAGSVLVIMGIVAAVFLLRNGILDRKMNRMRDLQDGYFQLIGDLMKGFRELKMNSDASSDLVDGHLHPNREENFKTGTQVSVSYMNNELMGTYVWYVIIGVVLFAFSKLFGFDQGQVSIFLVTLLYMVFPTNQLVIIIPYWTRFNIAMDRLNKFEGELENIVEPDSSDGDVSNYLTAPFESLQVQDVTFEYYDHRAKKNFTLGPISLKIERGEIVFVTGGNGSGKSTFMNILSGLYHPVSGSIKYNGTDVPLTNYQSYRNLFAPIFTNGHLFSQNYLNLNVDPKQPKVAELLQKLGLDGIVSYNEEKKWFDDNLSKGQQKRLAMLYTILQDKEIILLDEWAAEQDPGNRAYFYRTLLPELAAKGKTVVAVTHDDEFFDYCTRKLKFNYGKLHENEMVNQPETAD
jgi:cyclic peptide transporter